MQLKPLFFNSIFFQNAANLYVKELDNVKFRFLYINYISVLFLIFWLMKTIILSSIVCATATSLFGATYYNDNASQTLADILGKNTPSSADNIQLRYGIEVENNADMSLGELELSYPQGGASWTQSAGTLTVGSLLVGNATEEGTKGLLKVESGAKVVFSGENTATSNTFIQVARQANSTGQIDISGEFQTAYAGDFTIGQGANSNAVVNVNSGGKLSIDNISNLYLASGSNSNAELNVYGDMTVSNGTVYLGRGTTSNALLNIDGGTFLSNKTSGDLNFFVGDTGPADCVATVRVQNNGVLQQQSDTKNIQFNIGRHGIGNLEILSGGAVYMGGNFTMGDRGDSVANLIMDNGKIGGATGGTSFSGDINMATASGAKATANISNGSEVRIRAFYMSQGGNNASSSLVLKDQGTLFQVSLVNDANYLCKIGVNGNTTNSALIEIHTGAQFRNNQNTVNLYESGQIKFVLDSDNASYAEENSIAMFRSPVLNVVKSDTDTSSPFVIDGSKLKANDNYTEGQEVAFILMSVQTLLFNDVEVDFLDLSDEIKESLFLISHNENLDSWQNFGYDNLSHDGENFILTLTYVPEPSACAAAFGILAFALVFFRGRKNGGK